MKKDLASRLWSWSMHTGDTLFSEAAEEIENLKKQLSNSYSAVFKNSDNLNKELNQNSTDSSRELDIVEELLFFAEAADSDAIVVTMLSGGLFLEAAKEIEHLRLLIQEAVESREARDRATRWDNLDAKNELSFRMKNAWKALKNSIDKKENSDRLNG
jgi:hypothetical protein